MNRVARAFSLKHIDVWNMDLPDFERALRDTFKRLPVHESVGLLFGKKDKRDDELE